MKIETGQVVAGRYRLERKLSQGGMGSVWVAHHLQLNTLVALKFMREHIADDAVAIRRFEREAKASAKIRSPHIVHIYDHGVDEGVPYLAMEYLEGEDLRQRLKRDGTLKPYEAVRICEQVCKGLEKAHELQIVHRDLKPANIFLCSADEDMIKILDFGIAKEMGFKKVVESDQTETGKLLGSPHYMSPEQATSERLDGRSDLWSLAVILFRALTGERPYPQEDLGSLIIQICTRKPLRVSKLRPDLAGMDRFFERAFTNQADGRFQDAKEFSKAFKRSLATTLGLELPDESAAWAAVTSDSISLPVGLAEGETLTSSAGSKSAPSLSELSLADNEEGTLFDTSHTLGTMLPKQRRQRQIAVAAAGCVLVGAAFMMMRDSGTDTNVTPAATQAAPTATTLQALPTASTAPPAPSVAPSTSVSAKAKPAPSAPAARPKPRPPKPVVRPVPRPPPPSVPRPKPSDLDITDY